MVLFLQWARARPLNQVLGGCLARVVEAAECDEVPLQETNEVRLKLMKTWITYALLLLIPMPAFAAAGSDDLAKAKAEILPLFEAMQAAANAHDAEKHISYYAREPDLLFVINDRAIVGWDSLLEQQREWWQDGKTDVTYTLVGRPDFRMPAPGLVMTTYFLTSRRTMADGTTRNTRFGISALWQRRREGWRIIYAHESTVNQ